MNSSQPQADLPTVRLLAVIEAATVTGPAKNLLEFCSLARNHDLPDLPRIEPCVVTYVRSANAGEPASNRFIEAARAAGIDCEVVRERRAFDRQIVGALREIVNRRAPHIVQTHNIKSHFLVKLSGLHRKYPWVAFHHGYTATDLKMRAYNQLDRWSLPSAAKVITVCKPFARELEGIGVSAAKISVLHNSVRPPRPVSPDAVRSLRERLTIPANARMILAAGRLSFEKGLVDLVAAVALLPNRAWRLVLAGQGPEKARIVEAIAHHELERNVLLVGHQPNLHEFYALANIVALPSHSEGSPNVLLEAMAAGLPIAATAVGGTPEIATHEQTALLVPPRIPAAMAEALQRLLTDQAFAQRLASQAQTAAASFYPEAYVRTLLGIYRDLLKSQSSPTAGLHRRSEAAVRDRR